MIGTVDLFYDRVVSKRTILPGNRFFDGLAKALLGLF